MPADDQIEELKRIIEEDRRLAEAKKQRARELRHLKYIRRKKTEAYERDKEYQRRYKRKRENRMRSNALLLAALERKKIQKAGRPRPSFCEVCNSTDKISFDHDHKTGKFRGWLCRGCNNALGFVEDDPVRLEKLAVYLRTHYGE